MLKIVAIIFLLISSSIAFADEKTDDKVVYKSTTEIDFDSLNIDGEIIKPQGTLVMERRRATFNPMIQIRLNWNEEIANSTDDVK
jgi:hypothetical protein